MREPVNKKEIQEKINPVIEKVASHLNLIPIEIDFAKESGKWHLKIFIYSPEHLISHKDCEDLTRNLSDYLDQLIPVHYYLEVSSPGTERKLRSPREYVIFKGKQVEVKLKQPQEEFKVFEAKIVDYNTKSGLQLSVLNNDKTLTVNPDNISSIKLKPEYNI